MTAIALDWLAYILLITTLTPRFNQFSTMCPVPSYTDRSITATRDETRRHRHPHLGGPGSWWIGQVAADTRLCAEVPRRLLNHFLDRGGTERIDRAGLSPDSQATLRPEISDKHRRSERRRRGEEVASRPDGAVAGGVR
jgi:hypothetical protein